MRESLRPIALTAMLVVLAGCASPGAPAQPQKPVETSNPDSTILNHTLALALDLDWVPPGSDWVLFEVFVGNDSSLVGNLSFRGTMNYPVPDERNLDPPLEPCWLTSPGYFDTTVVNLASDGIRVERAGKNGQTMYSGIFGTDYVQNTIHLNPRAKANTPIPILFGLDAIDEWRERGADFRYTLTAQTTDKESNGPSGSESLHWRQVSTGQFSCTHDIDEFEEGDFARWGSVVEATGLASRHSLTRNGLIYFLVASTGEYAAQVEGPDGRVAEAQYPGSTANNTFKFFHFDLEPGEWTLSVPRLRASPADGPTSGAVALYVVVPGIDAWARSSFATNHPLVNA